MNSINNNEICKPVFVYVLISLIIMCIGVIIRSQFRPINFVAIGSQLGSTILCAVILMGLCNYSIKIAWGCVILFILITLIGLITIINNWMTYNPKFNINKKIYE